MTPRIKICGITRVEDARAAVAAGADAIGFVFAPSKRRIDPARAAAIAAALPPFVAIVGVFRDATDAEVRAALAAVPLTHLQFHGAEPPAAVAAWERPVIKALPLADAGDLERARAFHAACPGAVLLADARDAGSGTCCDWSLAAALARETPLILAGGLTPANVAAAVAAVGPAGVDVSSGVEASPGHKDPARIAAFVHAARGASGSC